MAIFVRGHVRCTTTSPGSDALRADSSPPAQMEMLEPRVLLDASLLSSWASRGVADVRGTDILASAPQMPPVPAEYLTGYDRAPAVQEPIPPAYTGVFDILVEPGLLASIQSSINQYVADLTAEGYTVSVQEYSGTADDLRAHLQARYTTANLEGALFVGDLPVKYYTHANDFNGQTVTFIHDLYFMDMDGTYVFNPAGTGDQHTGDVGPEIYISRITPSGITGMTGRSEVQLINDYFARVHAYRTGQLAYENRGILWSDDDWQYTTYYMGGTDLYSEILNVRLPAETTRQSYVDCLVMDYEMMFDMIHSGVTSHSISGTGSGNVSSTQIFALNPRQGFYNLWNCSSGRFTYANNLIATYVYSGDYGLNAVGSTKTGSMLASYYYYRYQGEVNGAHSTGQSFQYWFDSAGLSSDTLISWHYGMTMQGDPTLRPAVMGDRGLDANAGADRSVVFDGPVTLDGSASHSLDGEIDSYLWEQVSGPAVSIVGADQAIASFQPTDVGQYVFRLTVADGGVFDTDEVTIQVYVPAPTGLDLTDGADTGASHTDNVTSFNNADGDHVLEFRVSGSLAGAYLTLYADGVAIGNVYAHGDGAYIVTNGADTLADGPHSFTVRQQEPGKPASGDSPAIVVTIDTTRPTMPLVAPATATQVDVYFNEVVTEATAELAANYQMDNDLSVLSAALGADGDRVTLTLSGEMAHNVTYTVTVNNVQDLAGNAVAADSQASFTFVEDPSFLVWWTFDEGGAADTAVDATGNGRDLLLVGAQRVAGGRVGSAAWFDGVDDYAVDDDGELYLNGLGAVTVAMWIKADAIGTERGFFTTADPPNKDCLNARYNASGSDGGGTNIIKAYVQTDSDKHKIESASGTQTTAWQHVALTWADGDIIRLYIDGQLQAPSYQEGVLSGLLAGATKVLVGTDYKTPNGSWKGLIDDVRIYGRRLTPGEIASLSVVGPTAVNDTYSVEQGQTLSVAAGEGVLVNDYDPEPGPLAMMAALVSGTAHGELTLQSDGSFQYAPAAGFAGSDTFTYRAFDGAAFGNDATVTLRVEGPPYVEAAYAPNSIQVVVDFSKPMDEASAETAANYQITGGLTVQSASLLLGGDSVLLWLSDHMTDAQVYTVTVNNVADLEGTLIPADSQASFEYVGWIGYDVSEMLPEGSQERVNGVWTIEGAGADIWNTSDEFRYVYRAVGFSGDGEILARVVSIDNTDPWAKAGVMFRETISGGSTHAMTVVTPANGVSFQRRLLSGQTSYHTTVSSVQAPYWVRLVRLGDTFIAHMSDNGRDWNQIDTATVAMGSSIFVGLAVTSHDSDTLTEAVIDNVRVVQYATANPTATIADLCGCTGAIDSIEIVFDRPVYGLDLADLSLTRNGGGDLLTGGELLTSDDDMRFTLSGLSGLTGEEGAYTVALTAAASGVHDISGRALLADAEGGWLMDIPAEVVGRHVFYNHSAFDGGDPAANAADDGAIAPDKEALLPNEAARFRNYTSYSRGLNGIMVDIAHVDGAALDLGDFEFRVGNSSNGSGWSPAPALPAMSVRLAPGGAARVTFTWPDNVIQKQWLQVSFVGSDDIGAFVGDVFYFGNAIGETGDSSANANVDSGDRLAARANPHGAFNPAGIDDLCDFNRDKLVDSGDRLIARANTTSAFTALQLITGPAPGAEAPAAPAAGESPAADSDGPGPADRPSPPSPSAPSPQAVEPAALLAGLSTPPRAEAPVDVLATATDGTGSLGPVTPAGSPALDADILDLLALPLAR